MSLPSRLPLPPLAFIAMLLLLVVPTAVNWRVLPDPSFYHDHIAVFFVSLLLVVCACWYPITRLPVVSWVWWGGALLLLMQLLAFNTIPYPGKVFGTALLFFIMGLLSLATVQLVSIHGKAKVLTWIAWGIIVIAVIQAIVAILQFTEWDKRFAPWVFVLKDGDSLGGQMGQRNLLGDQLFLGVMASCYLLAARKAPTIIAGWLIVFLGVSLGLVSSRTIIAYLLAIAVFTGVWLAWFNRNHRRAAVVVFFALGWVLLMQWLLSDILSVLGLVSQSGLDRLQQGPGLRFYEWQKAWGIFLQHPIFGGGWSSYSYLGFDIDASMVAQRPYAEGRLFTHSHSIVLQILAETGIIGFVILIGGLAFVCLRAAWLMKSEIETFFGLCLIGTLLTHSLLEYPLWQVNFLVGFAMILAVTTTKVPEPQQSQHAKQPYRLYGWLSSGFAIVLCLGVIYQFYCYYQITLLGQATAYENPQSNEKKALWLYDIGDKNPLLAHLAHQPLLFRVPVKEEGNDPKLVDISIKYGQAYPFPMTAFSAGLNLYNNGEEEKARAWLQKTALYYPTMTPTYIRFVTQRPKFASLNPIFIEACTDYFGKDNSDCVPPKTGQAVQPEPQQQMGDK